ncbi:MAG: hypothetical protein IT367_19805 [Candidatus Hydrogenedentes bacterium]|nr:hypothetical protein [Candidatus Hydrogenedentota bacterium]
MSTSDTAQLSLLAPSEMRKEIRERISDLIARFVQPTASELLQRLEKELGWAVRWELEAALREIEIDKSLSRAVREYVYGLIESGEVEEAIRGGDLPDRETATGIDALVHASNVYRSSEAFSEMITFMARFREYAPYNNMLVKVQNPSCGFYAREKDWRERFGRYLKEDARPMLILAPMHPVLLVSDVDQTDGAPLPKHLTNFAKFEGEFDPTWLSRMTKNAGSYGIRVDVKTLSSSNAGFATTANGSGDWKMRIALHDGLGEPSRLGVLCHELAHILLGHLGTDRDLWWPCRTNLTRQTVEIEAESVAYIVTTRLGLEGSSAAYVSGHLRGGPLPDSVSLDLIAKVAGAIEKMARENVPPKKPRPEPKRRRNQ